MTLCRWSTSAWYIYKPCGTNRFTIEVCLFGQVTVPEIIRNYDFINKKAKLEGYSFFERLELRAYLKLWAYFKMKKLSFKTYVKGLEVLRGLRQIQYYIQNPYDYKPFLGEKGNIPNILQVKKTLCNKSLAKYEERRQKRKELYNSPLAKAMREE